MKKLVLGVGVNDKSRPTWVDGKITKEYNLWRGILNRCFDDKCQNRQPTYKGCSVSDNFLNYAYFYDWCNKQIGFNKTGWHLDKDVLSCGNKQYGEDVCVFIPLEVNTFFTDRGNNRGEYPVGVSVNKQHRKYQAQCSGIGHTKHLGHFDTVEEAFLKYKMVKEALCKQLALKWKDEIDPRVYEAMMKWEVGASSYLV